MGELFCSEVVEFLDRFLRLSLPAASQSVVKDLRLGLRADEV